MQTINTEGDEKMSKSKEKILKKCIWSDSARVQITLVTQNGRFVQKINSNNTRRFYIGQQSKTERFRRMTERF